MALYAATALLAVVFAVAVVGAIVRAVSDGPQAAPAIQARFRWQDPPEIRLEKTGRTEEARSHYDRDARGALRPRIAEQSRRGASASDAVPRGAVVRWREEEKLRRAAGILLIDDDYEGAMELLLQVKGEDSRAFALDRAAHGKILGRLQPALLREREALGAFLRGLPESAELPYAEPLLLQDFFALPPQELHLPRCAAALPERVALSFVRNVHVRLARATGANDTLLALVLGLGFPQGSDAARVYWEDFPEDLFSYDEVLPGGI